MRIPEVLTLCEILVAVSPTRMSPLIVGRIAVTLPLYSACGAACTLV